MPAFKESKHHERGEFDLESVESTGERGELMHEITLPDGLEAYALLVEAQAKGGGESFYVAVDVGGVRVGEAALAEAQKKGYGAYLHTEQNPVRGKQVRINVFVTAGAKVKVSVLKVFRRAKDYALSKISCEGCKKLLRFIISSILAQFGVVLTPDDFIPVDLLPPDWTEALRKAANSYDSLPKPLRDLFDFVGHLFRGGLVDILKAMSDILKEAFKPLDYALKVVCTKIGCCAAE